MKKRTAPYKCYGEPSYIHKKSSFESIFDEADSSAPLILRSSTTEQLHLHCCNYLLYDLVLIVASYIESIYSI